MSVSSTFWTLHAQSPMVAPSIIGRYANAVLLFIVIQNHIMGKGV